MEVTADVMFKKWSLGSKSYWLIIGLVMVGVLVFKEDLSLINKIGIILGIIGIILIEM